MNIMVEQDEKDDGQVLLWTKLILNDLGSETIASTV